MQRRFSAQLLTGTPARTPVEVAERLLAIQAQDPRGARLAVRARTRGLRASSVDAALTDDRSLVITWLNRGTLHLVRAEDYHWLFAVTTPQLMTANATRLRQEGLTLDQADKAVDALARHLLAEGPLTRHQIAERLTPRGVPEVGQGLLHVLFRAALRGVVVRGPMIGRQHAYVLTRDWLGDSPAVDRDQALAELARRFLAGHAPATERDLSKWAGVTLGDARRGLASIAGELSEAEPGLLDLRGRRIREDGVPRPMLLGAFDPLLHGWTTRVPVLGRHDAAVVSGGVFRPFVLVNGAGVGTWRWQRENVDLELLEPLGEADRRALDADAADVHRFLTS